MEVGQAVPLIQVALFTWDFGNLITKGARNQGLAVLLLGLPGCAVLGPVVPLPPTCLSLASYFRPSFLGAQGQVCTATQVDSLFLNCSP